MLGVGKLGDAGRPDIAAAEHLVDIHLGHAACGVAGVVVVGRVDHQTVEHALHLFLHFVEQAVQVAGLQEFRDVVVGVEALASCGKAFTDADRHGRPMFGIVCIHGGIGVL